MNPKLTALKAKISSAEAKFADAVRDVQRKCKHTSLAECDYMSFNMGGSLPPMRVCLDCGMTEDGWGCGYVVLRGSASRITRDELYRQRAGFSVLDKHKGPLLRRETSVRELVEEQQT